MAQTSCMSEKELEGMFEDLFGGGKSTSSTPPADPPSPTVSSPPAAPSPRMSTLRDARQFVESNRLEGVPCPCCDQYAKEYHRPLNSTMARGLLWIVRQSGEDLAWVYVPDGPRWLISTNQVGTLAHWGLIEQRPKDTSDTGRRTSGYWKPTAKGVTFAEGGLRVPARVHLYNNEVVGWGDRQINIVDALGKRFDYKELMSEPL